MVVSIAKKVNGAIFSISLEIFDTVMLIIDSMCSLRKGTKYSSEDIYHIKRENRRIVKEFFCPRRQKPKKQGKDRPPNNSEDNPNQPQHKKNNDSDDSDGEDKPKYNFRRQNFGSMSDYGSVSGNCGVGGG